MRVRLDGARGRADVSVALEEERFEPSADCTWYSLVHPSEVAGHEELRGAGSLAGVGLGGDSAAVTRELWAKLRNGATGKVTHGPNGVGLENERLKVTRVRRAGGSEAHGETALDGDDRGGEATADRMIEQETSLAESIKGWFCDEADRVETGQQVPAYDDAIRFQRIAVEVASSDVTGVLAHDQTA